MISVSVLAHKKVEKGTLLSKVPKSEAQMTINHSAQIGCHILKNAPHFHTTSTQGT